LITRIADINHTANW